MIAFLKGLVDFKGSNYINLDVNGVGYKVYMPDSAIHSIEIESKIKVYTYLRMTQDDVSLFGFLTNEELTMFELLISVGGIGAKSAIGILSNIEPSQFAMAVIMNDVNKLKALPGIGPKTAARIILELKDKIKSEQAISDNNELEKKIQTNQNTEDAIDALQVLGYNRYAIEKALEKVNTEKLALEEIIKEGLKLLGR